LTKEKTFSLYPSLYCIASSISMSSRSVSM